MGRKILFVFVLIACLIFSGKTVFGYTEKEYLQLAKVSYENEFHEISLNYLVQFNRDYPQSSLRSYALLLEGLNLRKLNRFLEARKSFTSLIENYPESTYLTQAYYLRGETNLSSSAFSQAESDFRTASTSGRLEKEMAVPAYQGLLASQANQGKFFEALTTLQEWEGKYPEQKDFPEGKNLLINAATRAVAEALKEKDFVRVHTIARLVLDAFPAEPSLSKVRYYQATASWHEGNSALAQSCFLDLTKSPDAEISALASFRLGDIFFSLKDYGQAALYYRAAEEKSADAEIKMTADFQLGVLAQKEQDYVKSAEYLQKARSISGAEEFQEKVLYELAGTIFLSGDYEKALSFYREFRKVFPLSSLVPNALLQEAFSLYNLKDYDEAKRVFEDFVHNYPANEMTGQAYYGLGLTFIARGDKKAAAAVWEGFLSRRSIVSDQAPMVLFLARFFIEEKRSSEAIPYLKRITASPNIDQDIRAEAYLLSGLAYLQQNKPEESLSAFDAGLALKSREDLRDSLLKNKADLLLAKGEYGQAIPIYQQIQGKIPDRKGEILYGLGVCLQRLDRSQEAVPVYLEALINLPGDSPLSKEIKDSLAQIKKSGK